MMGHEISQPVKKRDEMKDAEESSNRMNHSKQEGTSAGQSTAPLADSDALGSLTHEAADSGSDESTALNNSKAVVSNKSDESARMSEEASFVSGLQNSQPTSSRTLTEYGYVLNAGENPSTKDKDSKTIMATEGGARKLAAEMITTEVYSRLLKVLNENPNGLTCSKIVRDVQGFVQFLSRKRNSSEGKGMLSPALVLKNCPGIRFERTDGGHHLFFLDLQNDGIYTGSVAAAAPKESNPSLEPSSLRVDSMVVMECLQLLQSKFGDSRWPPSQKLLKQFLVSLNPAVAPAYMNWQENGFAQDLSLSKRRKLSCAQLVEELKRNGCLSGTVKSLKWDLAVVKNILAQTSVEATTKEQRETPRTIHESASLVRQATTNSMKALQLVDTMEQLDKVRSLFPFATKGSESEGKHCTVAVDCEGVPETLFLVQVSTVHVVYIFDCVKLGASTVCSALEPMLDAPGVTKLFHDLHKDAAAFHSVVGLGPLRGTMDTQLAMEYLTGDPFIGFNRMLQHLGEEQHPTKYSMKVRMDKSVDLFSQRPLPSDVLQYAANDVWLLIKAEERLRTELGSAWDSVQQASDTRSLSAMQTGGSRNICFDVANGYAISSLELLQTCRPSDMLVPSPLEVSDDSEILLKMLPKDLVDDLAGHTMWLSDIVLDKGRKPHAWSTGERFMLGDENRIIEPSDIDSIVLRLGGFGSDNRAGLEKQLHRISAIRNRQDDIIGLTMRVGRHVMGNASMISDLLFRDVSKSILFLGEPGSGKTTVVREVTRLLAERSNVCIVDTSNEIAGDGDVPHPCVGFARRMMVRSLNEQAAVMIECVQNHTPEIMVIDEIGRPAEVEAARTCKQRGVRLIASAHGDLRKLIKNPKLRGLIGGVETVTLGDAQAREESKKGGKSNGSLQKLLAQRAGPPTFDVIVELHRGAHHEWRIVLDAADAVDQVLEGQQYKVHRRTRDPETGAIQLDFEKA